MRTNEPSTRQKLRHRKIRLLRRVKKVKGPSGYDGLGGAGRGNGEGTKREGFAV